MAELAFRGSVALVTGAAGDIGAAIAGGLCHAGVRVALVDVDGEALDRRAAELRRHGGGVSVHVVDLRDLRALPSLVRQVESELGPVDYLVHAAGVLRPAAALEASEVDWEQSFAVNARGPFFLSQAVARNLLARGAEGAIVTVGSNAGATPRVGMGVYGATKAALAQLTRSLGLELARHGIRCNLVSPGSTQTSMLRAWGASEARLVAGDPLAFKLGIPLGRVAEPGDVAAAVLFLLSDGARHVTLHDLRVDGGASLDA